MTRAAAALLVAVSMSAGAQVSTQWPQHSMERPRPPIVKPGPFVAAPPPADAMVLFDGKSLAKWQSSDSAHGPAKWKVVDGYMEVAAGTGGIETRDGFGDCQLHVEWRAPTPPKGESQERGNSGVFLMGRYEVQVLDSYNNITYADGQAASVYGQFPPLVNASRPPGEWQSYDIIWHRPHFDAQQRLVSPARITVFHNGLLAQDNVILSGPTAHQRRPPYSAHPDALPLGLQDHGNPVRYRNIWIRKLE
jgi:3-keto-disaccharide hydrolase